MAGLNLAGQDTPACRGSATPGGETAGKDSSVQGFSRLAITLSDRQRDRLAALADRYDATPATLARLLLAQSLADHEAISRGCP